jgi:5-methylcytosine-specific restriction endonuclease McrA
MRAYHPVALKIPARWNKPYVGSCVRDLHREQGGLCFYCEQFVGLSAATVDHYVPSSHGGSDRIENKVMACGGCNTHKADRMPAAYFALIGKPLKMPPLMDC